MNNHYYKKLNKRNDIYLFKIVSLSDKSVTIQININNFRSKDGSVIKRYTLKDDEGKEEDEIGLIKYDIYLENIKEKYYNNDKLTKLEKYMLMLKLRKREELLEVSKGDKDMSEVYKKDQLLEQMRSEVMDSFEKVLNELGYVNKIPVRALPSQKAKIKEIKEIFTDYDFLSISEMEKSYCY